MLINISMYVINYNVSSFLGTIESIINSFLDLIKVPISSINDLIPVDISKAEKTSAFKFFILKFSSS